MISSLNDATFYEMSKQLICKNIVGILNIQRQKRRKLLLFAQQTQISKKFAKPFRMSAYHLEFSYLAFRMHNFSLELCNCA